ncbi:protein hinderin isoform X2 [Pelobates fuscus]|uniref:protein hinderin isoform X2 n=1 Tax=Pelobates fuscus TaxID=191477 RepID=UPI002FE4B10E
MLLGKELLVTGVWMVSFTWLCAVMESIESSDEDQQMVYIPGLSKEGNLRTISQFKNKKTEDTRPKVRTPASVNEMDLRQNLRCQGDQVAPEEGGIRSASLKDLCPEDKRRIANLIKELARVSEEKEVTEERLKIEHKSFEKKIRQLEEQNDLIITEREALQQQYRECQELLSLYQKYLSEQQEKLNLSLSELSAGGSMSRQMTKSQRKPTSSELNGSYLAQPFQKASSASESSCLPMAKHHCKNEPNSRIAFRPNTDQCRLENHLQRKCGSVDFSDIRCTNMAHVCQRHSCGSLVDQPAPQYCIHCMMPNLPATSLPDYSSRRPSESCTLAGCSPTFLMDDGAGTLAHEAAVEKSLAEKRKHEILLQKMELEMEKERLQQLLAQQEEKLIAKQQELQQSKLDYSNRSLLYSDPRPLTTDDISRQSFNLPNGLLYSPVNTPPPTKNNKKQQRSGGNSTEKRGLIFNGSEQDDLWINSRSSFQRVSRKDAATSPSVTSEGPKVIASETSPVRHNVCRYETSLIDMLEAVSPLSTQRQPPLYREPCDFTVFSPIPRSHFQPSRRNAMPITQGHEHPDNPDENRMLEDIFFIC